jgi:hypothetical protein
MAKDKENMHGPTQSHHDATSNEHNHRHAQSRDELKERTHQRGEKVGRGRRNGSDKQR